MPESTRRLAAVMFTDLAGYSTLSHENEPEALAMLEEHRGIVRPALRQFGGREVKTMGDGFLVEFTSALNAVRCAEEIQTRVHERNEAAAGPPPIVLRIGIHLGDVVEDEGDLYGNAVNVAARIEPFAEPGGICVSRPVFDQVRNTLRVTLVPIGTRELKNIPEPVELFQVVFPWASGARLGGSPSGHPLSRADPPGPGGPSIGRVLVLPFVNIGAAAGDEFFSDGMTEELIEKLAHVPTLRIIARTTSMQYKGTRESVRAIGRTLGVGTVVEGSVRKSENRVRITVQLIDAHTEEHLWSSSYNATLNDLFAIQDDVSSQIVAAISSRVSPEKPTQMVAPSTGPRETENLESYTDFLRGQHLWHLKGGEQPIREACRYFESALARDPHFVRARVGLANCTSWLGVQGVEPYLPAMARARKELELALRQSDSLAEAHSALALICLGEDDFAGAKREAQRAVELNPSLADPLRTLAQLAAGEGDIQGALRLIESAAELDPLDLNVMAFLGRLYFYSGREDQAVAHWERTRHLIPFRTWVHLTEYYLSHGEYDQAGEVVHELEGLRPTDPWTYLSRGLLAAYTGDRATAETMIQKLENLAQRGSVTLFLVGFIRLAMGETDAFFECMVRAKEMHALPTMELMYSPLARSVRTDPRYVELLGDRGAP